LGALESAISQPKATFDGVDLYPTLVEKAAALCFALVQNHPFVDGNKRVAHAAMETFLILNGSEVDAHVDVQERIMIELAAGQLEQTALRDWLRQHVSRSTNLSRRSPPISRPVARTRHPPSGRAARVVVIEDAATSSPAA